MEPRTGKDAGLRTIVILFPWVTEAAAPITVDALQVRLKSQFVREGLMIGQFHAASVEPGLHNPAFRPLRAPVPSLAIRVMVESDLPFLLSRPEHLAAYLARFGESGLRRTRAAIQRGAVASDVATEACQQAGLVDTLLTA